MALSNIFREPRREIIETAVGMAIMAALIGGDYAFARWFETLCGYRSNGDAEVPWLLGLIIGLGVALIAVLLAVLTHQIGEMMCDSLQSHGVCLRPRRRR